MSLIDIRNSIPSVYVEESRDFQLFINLLHCIQNGIKFDIDKISDVTSARNISTSYIDLLKSKVGFFTDIDITSDKLRIILEAFPFIIKQKGSLSGISSCVNCFLKLVGVNVPSKVTLDNNLHKVSIGINRDSINSIKILEDLLSYVIPTGYMLDIYFYRSTGVDDTAIYLHNTLYTRINSTDIIRNTKDEAENDRFNRTYSTVELMYADNIYEDDTKKNEDNTK